MHFEIFQFDSVDSTNEVALEYARDGADEGVCITARRQTAGRGRQGRRWVSEEDAGLYASVIFRPSIEPRELPLLTLMAGIAAADSLVEFGIKPDIKWVNDLLVDEKKIAGILSEAAETSLGTAVVVGIGVNLKTPVSLPDATPAPTSIEERTGRDIRARDLLDTVLEKLGHWYHILSEEGGRSRIISEWMARSSYGTGKAVRVVQDSETFSGVTDGLDPNGALRVKTERGTKIVQAGDVLSLRAAV